MTSVLIGLILGYLLRILVHEWVVSRCPRVRYGSQCKRRLNHAGPHKAWIDWAMSPTRMGHTEHWHDEVELS